MQTKGELNQEHYWIYETFKTYRHAPMFAVQPRTLMVFPSKDDAEAFGAVFVLLPLLTLRRVCLEELEFIIQAEFESNYLLLNRDDVYVVGSRYECMPLADYGDVPDG